MKIDMDILYESGMLKEPEYGRPLYARPWFIIMYVLFFSILCSVAYVLIKMDMAISVPGSWT